MDVSRRWKTPSKSICAERYVFFFCLRPLLLRCRSFFFFFFLFFLLWDWPSWYLAVGLNRNRLSTRNMTRISTFFFFFFKTSPLGITLSVLYLRIWFIQMNSAHGTATEIDWYKHARLTIFPIELLSIYFIRIASKTVYSKCPFSNIFSARALSLKNYKDKDKKGPELLRAPE